mgnify:CR=1 FL=1
MCYLCHSRYTPWGDEKLDPATQLKHSDTKEAFSIFRPIGEFERQQHPNPLHSRNQWPAVDSCDFRATMMEYFEQVRTTSQLLM